MDKVLKRVGLAKRTPESSAATTDSRRRRTKTRRRSVSAAASSVTTSSATTITTTATTTTTTTLKMAKSPGGSAGGGGLFHIDWDYVRECKSCKSRALLGRRFCHKKCDNALYRSNSFKFERFERGSGGGVAGSSVVDETSTLSKQVSLCDHYSIPADDLYKKQPQHISTGSLVPSGLGPASSDWNISSSNEEKVDILETYSTAKDNHLGHPQAPQNEPDLKYLISPDREYSQPYTTDKSSEQESDLNLFEYPARSGRTRSDLNSSDSGSETLPFNAIFQNPIKATPRKKPSPYYYSDLLKKTKQPETVVPPPEVTVKLHHKKQRCTLDISHSSSQGHKVSASNYKKNRKIILPSNGVVASAHGKYSHSNLKRPASQHITNSSASYTRACENVASCSCPIIEDALVDMNRQRRIYETAFDSRVSKSDDDLDQIDRVSNHPILVQLDNKNKPVGSASQGKLSSFSLGRRLSKQKYQSDRASSNKITSISALSQKLQDLNVTVPGNSIYSTSPPSTAPLPIKFQDKELIMNTVRSTPNLPSHSKVHLKNVTLPNKFCYTERAMDNASLEKCSVEGSVPTKCIAALSTPANASVNNDKSPNSSSSAFDVQYPETSKAHTDFKSRPNTSLGVLKRDNVLEIKDRPRKSHMLLHKHRAKQNKGILEYKGRRHKYSSTESMTTSSSGGSMESIKSSTSEGNRSTTSTDSRNSCSISSHDSDSGALSTFLLAHPSTTSLGLITQNTKLHILSPISDKSSQEPFSETSDNNRNNNSHKCSVEAVEVAPMSSDMVALGTKARRRLAQNKNLLNLGFRSKESKETQGSDSGISIQSREGIKPKFGLDLLFSVSQDLKVKLRSNEICTSDSATSMDFGELPFDMPKLRRRLRVQQSMNDCSISQASSSQSVAETDRQTELRPKLVLNLSEFGLNNRRPGLALTGLNSNDPVKSPNRRSLLDVSLPLEKQAWFHGAITRVEAESVLRLLGEGSFLVRNSESTKQDYSLSLKSARGYMHMRIQRSESGGIKSYILGQFSKPFSSIPEMIRHFSLNGLPIRGAEHMCLIQPVIAQLL